MKSIMRSKRAITSYDTIMQGVVRMVEYILIFFVLLNVVSLLSSTKLNTGITEGEIFVNRIIYSAAAQHDLETGRTYPGIIDAEKLDNGILSKQMRGNIAVASNIRTEEKEATYNVNVYNYLLPLAESQIPGKSAQLEESKISVIVSSDTDENEEISIKTVVPT